ncbi:hypothetical protein EDC94DRAFT_529522 [Helicostylum pulchrum]|nr:hypothetical protein EDC94DRAFT_529522 [Helicostylum pulchrum]
MNVKEVSTYRLHKVIRDWIHQQMKSNMDWKAIKGALRMSENSLDSFDMSLAFSKILAGMLVKYSDVQNSIVAKMNALSRKHATDKESVRLWMEELHQNRFYSAMYEVSQDPKGPFIVSWISPWRKMWYIDSTHKTSKSFLNPKEDCYLFTIIVRNKMTNKGVPVCFFVTNREFTNVIADWLE